MPLPVDADLEAGELPDLPGVRDHVLGHLLTFVRGLRVAGADVPANAGITAARALAEVGFDDRERVRRALRAALITRREDLALFTRLFPEFWRRLTRGDAAFDEVYDRGSDTAPGEGMRLPDPSGSSTDPTTERAEDGGATDPADRLGVGIATGTDDAGGPDGDGPIETAVYSRTGRRTAVESDPIVLGDEDDLAAPLARLTASLTALPGRRDRPGGDERPDARRALRDSLETGGAVVELPSRSRREDAVRAVILVDVSRSVLDTIDRGFLLRFLRAARAAWRDARVFFFDTDLREVTAAFDAPTTAAAARALADAEAEWGGGTRIGHAVATLREEFPTAVDRRTAVLVLSDGLEVGEIDALESGMAWLSSRAGVVLWGNPLATSPEYEPTCRGMAAARPYLDGLFAFAGPEDIAEMARQLDRHGPGGPVGFEYDPRRRSDAEP